MTMVTPALPHDQSLRGANASSGAFHGDWLVQDEIGAYFKRLLDVGPAIDQSKGNAALVGLSLPQFTEDQSGILDIIAVNHNGVILAPRQDVTCLVRGVAKIKVDIGRVQDTAYRTMYFRVATEEKSLQSHVYEVIGRSGKWPSD